MTTDTQTLPGQATTIGLESPREGMIQMETFSYSTMNAEFWKVAHILSAEELRRPRTASFTGAELKDIAQRNPPSPEWYEGEDERPF